MSRILIGEVIAIGDEITCGQLLDTNSQWVSQRLRELGVDVRFHSTVGDRLDDYQLVFAEACQRADLIVSTGGLGPTEDDLTALALARLASVELEFDQASWEHIQAIFARRKRAMVPNNRKQALLPRGSRAIPNPNGTAPGIDLELQRDERPVRIFAFPGVPAELREMWPSVAAQIQRLAGGQTFVQHTLNCFGAGESDIEAMIPAEVMRRGRDPLVGITASQATISLRVSTFAPSQEVGAQKIAPTVAVLRNVLGEYVYGEQDEPFESAFLGILSQRNESLAAADLNPEGTFIQCLGTQDNGRNIFRGGVQTNEGVIATLLDVELKGNAGREATLATIADTVRRKFRSDWGLAIGPIPAATAERQQFQIAIVNGDEHWSEELSCAGHPAIRLVRANKQVLNYFRLKAFPAKRSRH